MGNTQAGAGVSVTTSDEALPRAIESAAKRRRNSRVKVFGRFAQRKTTKEAAATVIGHSGTVSNSAIITSAVVTNTSTVADDNANDNADNADSNYNVNVIEVLQQNHSAVIQQLEAKHLDLGKQQQEKKPTKKRSKFFCRRNQHDDDDETVTSVNVGEVQAQKTMTMSRQKRPAPKPPDLAKTTTTIITPLAMNDPQRETTTFSNDHREFIEQLFDSSSSIVNAPEGPISSEDLSVGEQISVGFSACFKGEWTGITSAAVGKATVEGGDGSTTDSLETSTATVIIKEPRLQRKSIVSKEKNNETKKGKEMQTAL